MRRNHKSKYLKKSTSFSGYLTIVSQYIPRMRPLDGPKPETLCGYYRCETNGTTGLQIRAINFLGCPIGCLCTVRTDIQGSFDIKIIGRDLPGLPPIGGN